MEKCDTKMVKGRTKRLTTLFRSYFPHAGKEGRTYRVLCAEESTDKQFYGTRVIARSYGHVAPMILSVSSVVRV